MNATVEYLDLLPIPIIGFVVSILALTIIVLKLDWILDKLFNKEE